jgi:periplasmic protein TonB
MPTLTKHASNPMMPVRHRPRAPRENVSASFIVALTLHAALLGGAIAWGVISNFNHSSWGENSLQSGSIAVTAVTAIPLPPRQRFNEDHVLTSESPSIAPTPPKEKAEPPPKKDEVLIPEKTAKPPKVSEKPAPTPPKHVEVTPPTPTKATTGDSSGVRIPEAVQQVKNGTASITMDDRSFGQRYAYYAKIVDQKVSESWNTEQMFPGANTGMRAVVVFTINADGTPSDPRILTKSGSPAFDTLAIRTIQRIDGFGPLPQTKPITVEFALDYKQP